MSTPEPTTVVVCDDHRIVAEGLARLIDAEPDLHVVAVAGTVQEVEQAAVRHRPVVIVMDYELPDGNGVDATVAVKRVCPEAYVIMLTSFTNEAVLVGAIEAGCAGFVSKADSARDLVRAIRLTLAGDAAISPELLGRLLPRLTPSRRTVWTDLTPRETEVLELLRDGASVDAIQKQLFISRNTVRNHIQSILTKLGAHSRLEAVAIAVREGILHR